jgi:hypothetical protein
MKKLSLFLGVAFLFAMSAAAFAAGDVKTGDDEADAKFITISGGISVIHFWADEMIDDVLEIAKDGERTDSFDIGDSIDLTVVQWHLRFEAEVADNVMGVVEFEGRPVAGLALTGDDDYRDALGSNTFDPEVGECYIEAKEFLAKQLSWRAGIQDFIYDLRGDGDAFFIDLRGSERSFLTPVTENFGNTFGTAAGVCYFEQPNGVNGFVSANNGHERKYDAGGLLITYEVDENLSLDFFFMTAWDTAPANAAGAQGSADRNEHLYGIALDYNIPGAETEMGKSAFHAILAANSHDSNEFIVWTIGAGIDYFFDGWELYGEIYGQWGNYGELNPQTASVEWEEIDHNAFAGRAGVKYNFQAAHNPWLEGAFWYITGDDADLDDDSPDNEDFVSYEDVDDFVIVEDNLLGLDIDSNYYAFKVKGGLTFGLRDADDTALIFQYGYFHLTEEPDRAGVARANADLNIDEDLGSEIDLKINWAYSKSLSLYFLTGFLFGADFFEADDGTVNNEAYEIEDDDMWVIGIGTELKF